MRSQFVNFGGTCVRTPFVFPATHKRYRRAWHQQMRPVRIFYFLICYFPILMFFFSCSLAWENLFPTSSLSSLVGQIGLPTPSFILRSSFQASFTLPAISWPINGWYTIRSNSSCSKPSPSPSKTLSFISGSTSCSGGESNSILGGLMRIGQTLSQGLWDIAG